MENTDNKVTAYYNPNEIKSLRINIPFPNYGNMGWICPRCGKCNAPFVSSCSCVFSDVNTITSSGTEPLINKTEVTFDK